MVHRIYVFGVISFPDSNLFASNLASHLHNLALCYILSVSSYCLLVIFWIKLVSAFFINMLVASLLWCVLHGNLQCRQRLDGRFQMDEILKSRLGFLIFSSLNRSVGGLENIESTFGCQDSC